MHYKSRLAINIILEVIATVQFNYNFIFTRVSTRGNTRYFACV